MCVSMHVYVCSMYVCALCVCVCAWVSMRECVGVCECVCAWQISIHVYQTVDVFDLLPRHNCLMVEGQGYILHVCMCVWMCVNADLWHCRDSSYHKGENFGGRKIGMHLLCWNNFGNNRLQKELRIILE